MAAKSSVGKAEREKPAGGKIAAFLTPNEAADYTGIGRPVVSRLMESGRIKSINIGLGKRKYLRTRKEWLDEFLAGQSQTAAAIA